jgi:hypothetical protein
MDLLPIYLQDHLALALGGIRLARRCRDENKGTPLGAALRGLVPELEEDRETLKRITHVLGAGPSTVKDAAAIAGELAGRLKPNGRLLGYSELSRLWELEALMAGSDARRALWSVLGKLSRRSAPLRDFDFGALEERAARHHAELERLRVRAAEAAFGPAPRKARGAAAPAASRP